MMGSKLVGIVLGILLVFIGIIVTLVEVVVVRYYEQRFAADLEAKTIKTKISFRSMLGRIYNTYTVKKVINPQQSELIQGDSNGVSSNWLEENVNIGNIGINISNGSSNSSLDYVSASELLGIPKNPPQSRNNEQNLQDPVLSNTLITKNDIYDSFSHTLYLQNLLEKQNSKESLKIRRIRDPYLGSYIVVGGIVVVVYPFQGSLDSEFTNLQPGDLLRITKFYVKENLTVNDGKIIENNPSTHRIEGRKQLISGLLESDISIYSLDTYTAELKVDYSNIYCSGIMLNTYLEFNNSQDNLTLKFRDTHVREVNMEMYKEFPLNVVSLETTVLRGLASLYSTSFEI